jgi:hypothetical protein
MHGEIEGVFDLQFGIREKMVKKPLVLSSLDFSLVSPARFIPKELRFRNWVTEMIDRALERLIAHVSPVHLTMETYHPHVPPEGMGKYTHICGVLRALGYVQRDEFRDTEGVHYWFFVRNDLN